MAIRRLDPLTIDRIAAGEVIERPAAAAKELLENALDAGATRIDVAIELGGRGLIRVSDDGSGMDKDDLLLAVERHATSKLKDGDLEAIRTLGFRGEALPSIASVSRLEIRSRLNGAERAWRLIIEDGVKGDVEPVAHTRGTLVEARDLFASTPARLKFLKTDRAEQQAVVDVVRRLALANPATRFSFAADGAGQFDWLAAADGVEALSARARQALGDEFLENAVALDERREGVSVSGFAALPTFNKPNANWQFAFVNGRAVRDKLIAGALRAGYLDTIPRGRHPAALLFVACDAADVDVNVHPAKAEVRFRDSSAVRGAIIGAIQRALGRVKHRAAMLDGLASAFRPAETPTAVFRPQASPSAPLARNEFSEEARPLLSDAPPAGPPSEAQIAPQDRGAPLGAARAQLHETYIVAETTDGLVIVDQHAAHERIVYEKLKRQRAETGIERQGFLTPLVVDLAPDGAAALLARAEELEALGLALEGFGKGAVLVREAPALVAAGDLQGLVRDLAEDALADDGSETLERRLDHRLATIACHHSVRAGRILKPAEMNALLREMETTPNAGQCNHGRPTYVELKLADIERLFGRR